MRAVIMEIHKNYCIVMTRDGQFLRQEIPAGVFEVGDEITISKSYVYKPKTIKVGWLRSFAVGTMVVVIVAAVSVFGVWYVKQYRPLRSNAMLTEAVTGEAGTAPAPAEEKAAEAEEEVSEGRDTDESVLAMGAEQEEMVIFDKIYSLEEQTRVKDENIKEIISFSYEIVDRISLQVRFKNISSASSFSGTFTLTTLLSDGSQSGTKTIPLESFGPAQVKEDSIFLKVGETGLRLEVNGSTY